MNKVMTSGGASPAPARPCEPQTFVSPPLVSVGCAVYNGAATLRRALDALVQQDYPRIEIILCDDGSTDDSRAICRDYATRFPFIRYVENEKNLGLIGNFNQLFQLSTGKYFFWADQDDVRAPGFINKCAAVLEADKQAVLCHSHAGVFWKTFGNLMHVNTIDAVDNEPSVLRRYWRFLRRFSDTTIYGLIRSEALRQTALWRADVGSANALLFELLLLGKFRQVPETLYFYSATGLRYRPTPGEEFARNSGGRAMSRFRRPFLVLATNQTQGVLKSRWSAGTKGQLLLMLWFNVLTVNAAKAFFRGLDLLTRRHVPAWVERACSFVVMDIRDIHFVVRPEDNRDYLPEGWLLRKA